LTSVVFDNNQVLLLIKRRIVSDHQRK